MTYQQVSVPHGVFRAYDIRGIVDKDLNEDAYYSIGIGFACMLRDKGRFQVYLARDGRLSSERLAKALAQGLLDSGVHVFDIGRVPTPLLYFACQSQACDSGLIVTGSHNPAEYNGIKMVLAGKTLVQEDIEVLYQKIEAKCWHKAAGELLAQDVTEDYIQTIVKDIHLERPLKVVVDCGNSIGGEIVPVLIGRLACEVIPLHCEVDGHFPNHHPDPSVEANLEDLKAAVKKHKADLGLAFDGDADRLGLVTEQGQVIWPDRLMMLYARDLLKKQAGATIAFDVKCSSNLQKLIEAAGGRALMCATGHSIVKSLMLQENALLAGEMSGHIFFKDRWYGFDDAMYSACRLLEIVSTRLDSVSRQFADIPDSINTPELKIAMADELKFEFMRRFSETAIFPEAEVKRIDGLRVEFEQGWGLLRVSNTTPCLVARFEAQTQEQLMKIQKLFKSQILALNADLILPF